MPYLCGTDIQCKDLNAHISQYGALRYVNEIREDPLNKGKKLAKVTGIASTFLGKLTSTIPAENSNQFSEFFLSSCKIGLIASATPIILIFVT